jgi:F-type H+-transporting ATPase subunit alpha
MDIKSTDLVALFEKALLNKPVKELDEIGFVIQVGDNLCKVHGLKNAIYGELIEFDGGNKGIVMNLSQEYVTIFLLYQQKVVKELEIAKRTKDVFKIPVGFNLLSRVINAIGQPIDGLASIEPQEYRSIEVSIPSIVDRSPIDRSLETGILAIDALVPIGRGQRELIIGNRSTGKTSIAIDAILNQKDKDVYCIYVSIGQRQANLARIVNILDLYGALKYTTVVSSSAGEPPLNQYLAPYVGTTIAEFLRDHKKDVLIIYDDLTNHAIAYREMSLLMRRPPGREAYPGDVFYLHSRLLERSGKLKSGGSITALPIVEIQSDDITAYIPTNLISITDGQIFLDTKLFNSGIRPAVNVELSVSRVGGAAQTKAIKKMARSLRLELAQYNDILSFAQFTTELDISSQNILKRGAQAYELLKQKEFENLSFVDQVLMLFLLRENFLATLEIDKINNFAHEFISYIKGAYSDLYNEIKIGEDITDNHLSRLKDIASDFIVMFKS